MSSADPKPKPALDPLERRTMRKVQWHIIPLLVAVLFFSYLDRVNVGFAAVQMNRALGFSNTVFGTGAGFFAVGYALFAIPSTMLLHRLGARRWIALIVIAWGLCSAATAWVTRPNELMGARMLLGMAEAGFSPGVILYFSYWFPSAYRGRALGSFTFIQPLALVIGGPVSSLLLSSGGGFGLAGWQWLFIVEALPTVFLSALVFRFLTDRPDRAHWLAPDEGKWLRETLASERVRIERSQGEKPRGSFRLIFGSARVWMLCVVCLGLSTSGAGTVLFLPLVIRSMGFSVGHTGLVAAVPGIAAALGLPLWGYWTDRAPRAEWVVAAAATAIAVGLLGSAALLPSVWALAPISLAMMGYFGFVAAFWTLPSTFLTGAAAAAGIAFINIVGNLGNFTGPAILGRVADAAHAYGPGLAAFAAIAAVVAAVMALAARRSTRCIASLLAIAVMAGAGWQVHAESSEEVKNRLLEGFLNPPASAKPRVYWHWVDGNVTEEGIKLDLEWMNRVGIGGVINFDVGFAAWGPPFASPAWVSRPIVYPSADWQRAKRLTAELTDRLGMEFAVASSEGWTQTGGPWVTPAQSMKKLVWSETTVIGGQPFTGRLPAPPQTTGPFQNIRLAELGKSVGEPPVYYRDVATVAYPAPASEIPLAALHPTVTSSAGAIEAARLWDGDLATPIALPFGDGPQAWIQFSFAQPQRIQACTAVLGPPWFGLSSLIEQREPSWLEASDDGVHFRKVVDLPQRGAPEQTVAFAPVTARMFRVVMERPEPSALEKAGLAPKTVNHRVAELALLPAARVNHFEDKAGYSTLQITEADDTPAVPPADAVRPQDIVDLTDRARPDGSLDWTPPPGRWIVLRFGYSLMGHVNHPASAGGTGLEVDELNSAAMKAYADHYLAQFQNALGKDRMGSRGLQYVETDSAESGGQNWTDDLPAQFRRSRGYNLGTWLPVLAGRVVGSSSASDRFLWDFRQTLGELMASGHYGQLAASLHQRGMGLYSESHESGRALTADGMAVKRPADIPMGAIWAAARSINPPENYDADLEESAAVAHIYGKPLVAAEAFTAAGNSYGFDPENLRPFADRAMALGVNRFVIHSSAEQPDNRPGPGVGVGPYGTFFNRHETWAEQAAGWVGYLTRSSYLLQQGRFAADIAYLYGEDTNLTSLFHTTAPAIPRGYAFDFVNAEALRQEFSTQAGQLVTRSGARYRVLVLDDSTRRMSLPVLRKLQALVQAGAWIVGAEPSGSPSLADNESDYRSLVAQLWGTGRIAPQEALGRALREKGIEPDVDFGAVPNFEWRFVHRTLPQGELYFISNASSQAQAVEASFRVNGRLPEKWSADSGVITPLTYRVSHGRTVIPLTLAAHEAGFVMFLRRTAEQSRVVAPPQPRGLASLTGPWTVSFPSALGGAGALTLEKLQSWTEVNDPAVKYFSGTAVYRQTLDIRPEWLNGHSRLWLDLGDVKNLAEVLVNGRSIGLLWHAPFEADLTSALVAGPNRLEVKVTNLWPNRLIGDKQPGAAKTVFATFDPFKADSPLLPSGLLGPVRLFQQDE